MSGGGRLLEDSRRKPALYQWHGAEPPAQLGEWLGGLPCHPPGDLLRFWQQCGGGALFETEEMLSPWGEDGENVVTRSAWHRAQGMPADFVVFHEGAWISAVRPEAPRYVTFSSAGYKVVGEYGSLDAWYAGTLRSEYAARYGLEELGRVVEQDDAPDEGRKEGIQ
jgi:hypothetical protein